MNKEELENIITLAECNYYKRSNKIRQLLFDDNYKELYYYMTNHIDELKNDLDTILCNSKELYDHYEI